jgi:hypothetical protein
MGQRAKLYAMAIPMLERGFGGVRQAWSRSLWLRGTVLLLIALLVASAADLWMQAYYNLRQILLDRQPVTPTEPLAVRSQTGRNGDV